MGANSKIEWTDHTFNPWWGCEEISPACAHCYARTWAKRAGEANLWQGDRRRTSAANWRLPLKWNKQAAAAGVRARVFCASMADVFDKAVDPQWRADLFSLIELTPNLDWLLLTKRVGNVARMVREIQTGDWLLGRDNVWLGATICNQEEANRDIPKLLAVPARVHFLSIEPLLEPIELRTLRIRENVTLDSLTGFHTAECVDALPLPPIYDGTVDWVIVGGESGGDARPMHPDWARSIRDQCARAFIPFLFKQWGEWAPGESGHSLPVRTEPVARWWDGAWAFSTMTPNQSATCHRDDEPDVYRLGKKNAGRLLDGVTHDGFPKSAA